MMVLSQNRIAVVPVVGSKYLRCLIGHVVQHDWLSDGDVTLVSLWLHVLTNIDVLLHLRSVVVDQLLLLRIKIVSLDDSQIICRDILNIAASTAAILSKLRSYNPCPILAQFDQFDFSPVFLVAIRSYVLLNDVSNGDCLTESIYRFEELVLISSKLAFLAAPRFSFETYTDSNHIGN